MTDHLYTCGQNVTFTGKRFLSPSWTGAFIITKLLPSGGEEPRYEIRGKGEIYSRAAFENELSADSEIAQATET